VCKEILTRVCCASFIRYCILGGAALLEIFSDVRSEARLLIDNNDVHRTQKVEAYGEDMESSMNISGSDYKSYLRKYLLRLCHIGSLH
jgi:hypothetical protein